ncbi:hypothetical protein BCR33DRAFT_321380 [Rhizoclosmatium globosum]|uniref:Uncharacterized protein n=1 Tax=Rhizoclosmatium globosum TaxID=329046 RepID=A0A1Y2CZV7_9FUNG|nr:hypothetical protein BCR33DRAFT_321380 [Rhizoclosmatium globosum]|eukprot:ORY52563.1 hypothetical protein BCR33DRAFT_321380 [Rhizoclosmatium globosum]
MVNYWLTAAMAIPATGIRNISDSVQPTHQTFIDGLTFISFLLLLTVATIPISLYFCCRGFSKPNKNLVIHSHRKHITALGIGLAFVCVIIAVICGTRGNELVSRFVQSVPSTATSLSFDASFTISQVPTVVSNALSSLELSVNQTVEAEVSKLPIPISDFKSAGIPLLSVLKTLSTHRLGLQQMQPQLTQKSQPSTRSSPISSELFSLLIHS